MPVSGPILNPNIRLARLTLFLGSRLLFGAFLFLTSAYCLLAYIPFAYFGFLHPPLIRWVDSFARTHGYLYCAILLVLAADFVPEFRKPKDRMPAAAFVVLNLIFGAYQGFHRGLSGLSPTVFSYVWAMLALFPLLWLAAIDIATSDTGGVWRTSKRRPNLSFAASLFAAFVVVTAFSATTLLREIGNRSTLPAAHTLLAFGASLAFHFVIFGIFAAAMYLFRMLSERTPWPDRAQFILSRVFVCFLSSLALRSFVLPSISFEGFQADFFCAVISIALVTYAGAVMAKLRGLTAATEPGTAPNEPGIAAHRPAGWLIGAAAASLCAIAYFIPVFLGPTDWDFVLQKSAVLTVWAAVLGFLWWSGFSMGRKVAKMWAIAVLIVAVAGFGPYRFEAAFRGWSDVLDSYAGWDISFKTAYAVLSRSVHNEKYSAFYEFLKRNTNLRQPVGPAELSLVSDLKPSAGSKPNIFLFVIDSLRQDYLSPYNASVDFTPEIGKFGQDSIVFRNAFTRYAGTALSEPAIWAGVMIPHKQFIQPFYPVNNLQKLIDAEGYQSYISVDPILQQILRSSSSITQLDQGTKQMSDYDYAVTVKGADPRSIVRSKQNTKSWSNLDFVATLNELESKIEAPSGAKRPIFVYTQPQNVHTVTLEQSRVSGSRREISISELRRIDVAFGEFIRFLQTRGLYDNSIVIVTADHGDAYGEFGRFGHSDFLFPEVIRIPLIVHLPPRMRQEFVWDPQEPAFSIDIAPSLYYLLGHRPTLNSELAGRPLFTQTIREQASYLRSQYFIASSYAPVYGILGHNGDTLFIVDAVNQRNYFYDLSTDPGGVHNLMTPKIRDANENLIRHEMRLIARAYGLRAD
jgi:hypothetical protein